MLAGVFSAVDFLLMIDTICFEFAGERARPALGTILSLFDTHLYLSSYNQ